MATPNILPFPTSLLGLHRCYIVQFYKLDIFLLSPYNLPFPVYNLPKIPSRGTLKYNINDWLKK